MPTKSEHATYNLPPTPVVPNEIVTQSKLHKKQQKYQNYAQILHFGDIGNQKNIKSFAILLRRVLGVAEVQKNVDAADAVVHANFSKLC